MAWYIAITNPNCQRRAECELAALGYRAFWPKLKKWVSHARTKIAKEYPILGRYMFVEITDGDFFTVRKVNGIEALLTNQDGEPAAIADAIVWNFRERYMRGEWDFVSNETGWFEAAGEITQRRNPIPVGAIIRIMEGEFADLLTVVRSRKNGKVAFLPPGKRQFFHTRESNVRAA
jgi:transcription antitermination factor NusG